MEPVTSQADVPNPYFIINIVFTLVKLNKFTPKPLISNKYSGLITIKALFKGFLLSVCDVTAWAREVKHWTSTEEK